MKNKLKVVKEVPEPFTSHKKKHDQSIIMEDTGHDDEPVEVFEPSTVKKEEKTESIFPPIF